MSGMDEGMDEGQHGVQQRWANEALPSTGVLEYRTTGPIQTVSQVGSLLEASGVATSAGKMRALHCQVA